MLLLPQERNRPLLQKFIDWRTEKTMPFVCVVEQMILEQKQEILEQKQEILEQKQQIRDSCLRGIELGLKLRFKEEGQALFTGGQKITGVDWLRRFLSHIESADSLEDLHKLLP